MNGLQVRADIIGHCVLQRQTQTSQAGGCAQTVQKESNAVREMRRENERGEEIELITPNSRYKNKGTKCNVTQRRNRFYSLMYTPSPNICPTVRSMKISPQGARTCIEPFVRAEVSTALSQSSVAPQPHLPPRHLQKANYLIISEQVNGEVIREGNMLL